MYISKFPILEKLEKDYQEVLIKKSQLIMQRIMEDDTYDIELFSTSKYKFFLQLQIIISDE